MNPVRGEVDCVTNQMSDPLECLEGESPRLIDSNCSIADQR